MFLQHSHSVTLCCVASYSQLNMLPSQSCSNALRSGARRVTHSVVAWFYHSAPLHLLSKDVCCGIAVSWQLQCRHLSSVVSSECFLVLIDSLTHSLRHKCALCVGSLLWLQWLCVHACLCVVSLAYAWLSVCVVFCVRIMPVDLFQLNLSNLSHPVTLHVQALILLKYVIPMEVIGLARIWI